MHNDDPLDQVVHGTIALWVVTDRGSDVKLDIGPVDVVQDQDEDEYVAVVIRDVTSHLRW